MSIIFSDNAYSKMMLHILKHLKSNCYGVLVGEVISNKDEEEIKINEVFPFSHSEIFVPQLDLGLRMISDKLTGNNKIIGLYENLIINYDKENTSYSTPCLIYCDAIKQLKTINKPVLIEISNHFDRISTDGGKVIDSIEYKIWKFSNNNLEDHGLIKENENQFKLMKDLLSKNIQAEIVDIEDYLFNPELDMSNSNILKN